MAFDENVHFCASEAQFPVHHHSPHNVLRALVSNAVYEDQIRIVCHKSAQSPRPN